ncbi:hypothetical protein CspeluHIS016_0902980 [Cutaneotrichosporon spelunceum]|uniref:Transmembrane protein n=1 Tax=Cutaneotrichosporon spelunceum TaxID=1672016 RepID=A0AAD3YED9_9TREE|nr:hypothetical protein CspeluHIS016_0902980 [Cutaneotrichosporon spelunceum]
MPYRSKPSSSVDNPHAWSKMSLRHGSVSTQLQDWLAARSLATTLSTPFHTPLEEPIDPKNPNGRLQAPNLQLVRREPKQKTTCHNPSTATGVINFIIDAAENLPWTGLFIVLLLLPTVLVYGFIRRVAYTILELVNSVTDFWLALFAYPSDRVLRRAYLIRTAARTAVTLRVWIYVVALYGIPVPGVFSSWSGVSLAASVVIALLPISALAALLRPISSALAFLAKNLWTYGALYFFLTAAVGTGYAAYRFFSYVDRVVKSEEVRRAPTAANKVVEELRVFRAELERLRQVNGM